MSDILERTDTVIEVIPYDDTDSNHDTFTHIINPPANTHIWYPGLTTQDIVDIARATGQTVTSLCGHTWIPKRNPEKYPICQTCVDIAGELMRGAGE